ncbi:MAG TPA: lipase [Spirochaetota bacterium]|nr:lipase [Spirochaetota bacterium]
MKRHLPAKILLTLLILTGILSGCELTQTAAKGDPIILVHGFLGWGRDEVGGFAGHYYWGGWNDLQKILNDEGYETHTGVVGPFSSNWDRACELYAQLMGTKTDYGIAHSTKHNHDRYGRDFTGKALLQDESGNPDWGKDGSHKKVNLIAHSQGGHTVRILAQLMEQGSAEERQAVYPADEPVSPLFSAGSGTKNMIRSITTMTSTHNGTSLANGVLKLVPIIEDILVSMIAILGIDENETVFDNFYDFKLQQFGLKSKQEGESLKDYIARCKAAIEIFLDGTRKDTCLWDLSPEGAVEQNAWVHAQPNIYYFSYAAEATNKSDIANALDNWEYYQEPDNNQPVYFMPFSLMMCAYTCNDIRYNGPWKAKDGEFFHMLVKDRQVVDSTWWQNDGIVNTKSMNGPWLYPAGYTGPRDAIVDWDGETAPQKGVWNYGGVFENVDHFDVVGCEIFPYERNNYNSSNFTKNAEDWYIQHAAMLAELQ